MSISTCTTTGAAVAVGDVPSIVRSVHVLRKQLRTIAATAAADGGARQARMKAGCPMPDT
eukprot:362039-Chlamydomonas_euryale.AAC.3